MSHNDRPTDPSAASDLTGRRAIVTGAARGMGLAHSALLAARGARVVMVDIDDDAVVKAAARIDFSGTSTFPVAADITRRASAEAVIGTAAGYLGGIDILVHNAGRMYSLTGLADTDDDEFRSLFAVNVDAPLYLTRAALVHLRASDHGRVIFISSQWGQVPDGHSYGYMCSKAAQLGMMKAMAKELAADRILVNAVTPGAIRTRMVPDEYIETEEAAIPLGRLGEPDDIAEAVAFLASDGAAFITGQVIPVNGGSCIVGI